MRVITNRFAPTKPLGSPRLQLVQVGASRVPMANASTTVTYAPRNASVQMFNGQIFDFDRYWPNPLMRGEFDHSGLYRCGGDYQCEQAEDETRGIQSGKTLYKPILFYMHANCPSEMESDLQPGGCGKWLFTTGKITQTSTPFTVNMALEGGVDFGLRGTLDTPLVEASPTYWRYGPSLAQLDTDTRYIGAIENSSPFEDIVDPWFIPCGPPEQSDTWRFFPRDLNSNLFGPTVQFLPGTWAVSKTYTPVIGQTIRIFIGGNTMPRVKWLIRWNFSVPYSVTVVNELGVRTYDYQFVGPIGYEELFDNWSETALIRRADAVTYSQTAALGPVLTPGWNEINTADQETVIGVGHAWIN